MPGVTYGPYPQARDVVTWPELHMSDLAIWPVLLTLSPTPDEDSYHQTTLTGECGLRRALPTGRGLWLTDVLPGSDPGPWTLRPGRNICFWVRAPGRSSRL